MNGQLLLLRVLVDDQYNSIYGITANVIYRSVQILKNAQTHKMTFTVQTGAHCRLTVIQAFRVEKLYKALPLCIFNVSRPFWFYVPYKQRAEV